MVLVVNGRDFMHRSGGWEPSIWKSEAFLAQTEWRRDQRLKVEPQPFRAVDATSYLQSTLNIGLHLKIEAVCVYIYI